MRRAEEGLLPCGCKIEFRTLPMRPPVLRGFIGMRRAEEGQLPRGCKIVLKINWNRTNEAG